MKVSPEQRLVGRNWKVVVNGKRTLNGERHSITTMGTIDEIKEGALEDTDIFTVLAELAETAREECDMEYPDSIQATIFP